MCPGAPCGDRCSASGRKLIGERGYPAVPARSGGAALDIPIDGRDTRRHDISNRYIDGVDGGPVLELAILGLLKEQELHGYELKKRLTEALGPFSSVSFGSLYPALARLEAAGAVKAVEAHELPADGPPIPMTGSLAGERAAFRARRGVKRAGRARKVYGITDRGQRLVD